MAKQGEHTDAISRKDVLSFFDRYTNYDELNDFKSKILSVGFHTDITTDVLVALNNWAASRRNKDSLILNDVYELRT